MATPKASVIFAFLIFIGVLVSGSQSWGRERKGQLGFSGAILSGFPSSDFSELTNTAVGAGLELEFGITRSVNLGIIFNYLPFQGPDITGESTLAEEWRVINYGIGAKIFFDPEKEVVPYFRLGVLTTDYKADISRAADSVPLDTSISGSNKFTPFGGFGLRWDMSSRVGFSGELLFTKVLDVIHDVRGQRHSIATQYISFNLGATIFLGKVNEPPGRY